MTPPFHRATWHSLYILDAEGDTICHASGEAEMQLLLRLLNTVDEQTIKEVVTAPMEKHL